MLSESVTKYRESAKNKLYGVAFLRLFGARRVMPPFLVSVFSNPVFVKLKDSYGYLSDCIAQSAAYPMYGPLREQHTIPIPFSILLGSFVINILGLALPLTLLQVYDRIIPNMAVDTLTLMMGGLCICLVLDGILKYARVYLVVYHAAQFEHALSTRVVKRILGTSAHLFEKNEPGVYMDQFKAIDSLREFQGGQSRLLILDLPFVLIYFSLIGLIGGVLVFIPLMLLGVLLFAAVTLGRIQRAVLAEREPIDNRRYSFIVEALNGIATIKSMAMEPLMQRRYERLLRGVSESTHKIITLTGLLQTFGSAFSNLTMVSVVVAGATLAIEQQISIGAVAACTLLSGRTIQPFLRGLSLWTQFQNIELASTQVNKFFDLPEPVDKNLDSVKSLSGALDIHNLSFRHEGAKNVILDSVSLKIAHGEMISISGSDGSGKSTLLRLMSGQMKPSNGQVLIDGMDISGPHHYALRAHIAYVPQNPVVFQGTVLENLALFQSGQAVDSARSAAKAIGLEDDINILPDGYDTEIGTMIAEERSQGFLQLVVIARALALRAQIILFDEGNNMLDSRGDKKLIEALEVLKGGPTLVVVTNRPSLDRLADRRFEIYEGRLEERSPGSHPLSHEKVSGPDIGSRGHLA